MFPRRNKWKETYPGSVLRNAVGLRTRSRVILSPVCLERRLYGILRGLKLYHSVLIASSLLLSPYKPLHFGIGISRLKNDPIRSQKANLYQDSWIVGATAGWVKLIRCCPEISWKSANSSLFLSVQQKLSWTASTCNKNTAGFERGNWPWILTTCPYCPCFWRLVKIACWFNQVVSCIFV